MAISPVRTYRAPRIDSTAAPAAGHAGRTGQCTLWPGGCERAGTRRDSSHGPNHHRASEMSETALPVELRVVMELATAAEVDTGIARVVALLRRACGAATVEWWARDAGGELRLVASDGRGGHERRRFPLGAAGDVVVVGGYRDPRLAPALAGVAPILRRRRVEERLTEHSMVLARRNEALEDFAELVAHELKSPLQAALVAEEASGEIEQALELVDSLLEAARESHETASVSTGACLDEVLEDLGAVDVEVTSALSACLPVPPMSLRVIVRNLLRNAVAAGARHVHVTTVRSSGSSRLIVDDDGVGVDAADGYAAGSGRGLTLCSHIADRHGGAIELTPRLTGGMRATLRLREAP